MFPQTLVFGNQIFFYRLIQGSFPRSARAFPSASFFHESCRPFFQVYALPSVQGGYCSAHGTCYKPIFASRFPVAQMVFAHIHYNRFLELCAILFLLISFFCHKNMHLQKSVQLLGCIAISRPFFVRGYYFRILVAVTASAPGPMWQDTESERGSTYVTGIFGKTASSSFLNVSASS